MNQHYHSTFGAVQESQHIFIESGFLHAIGKLQPNPENGTKCISIIEVGFGTGLNALLTQVEAEKLGILVNYSALEAFPLEEEAWRVLNYPQMFCSVDYSKIFAKLHLANWNEPEEISRYFTIHKLHCSLETYIPAPDSFDLVYFDAFGPDAQPELWTAEIFQHLNRGLADFGILVTYSVKGTVVRALRSAGFNTVKLPGPPGKRHILRASRI